MQKRLHILIVDDDPEICQLLQDYLQKHNYKISTAHHGRDMFKVLERAKVDLIVLDIMLPGEDGISLCRELRKTSAIPIIMLSAAGEEADRVVGLEVGADDYLAKPFSPRELLARIKALLRRAEGQLGEQRKAAQIGTQANLVFLNWTLDQNKRRLISPERITVPLSQGEYELLLAFIEHPKRTLSRDQLMDITRGREATAFDRSIDVQVGRLRKKIEPNPKKPTIIVTMRGGGYMFTADVSKEQPS